MAPSGWCNFNNEFTYIIGQNELSKLEMHFGHVALGVREVVYLKSSIKFVGSTGIALNPYILAGN